MTKPVHRPIRSFVLRQGRLTNAQQHALDNYWLHYGIDFSHDYLDFEKIFGNTAPVTLEIGFGNGDSLLEQACEVPQRNFIGIEVHRPGVGHLLHRIQQENINNLRVINHDAVEVLKLQIPENSLDRVQLFFPDPWHKKRHHKRRILQNSFIELIRTRLVNGGRGFTNTAGSECFVPADGLRPQTKFEKRGRKLGHGVWDLLYRKTG